MAFRETVSGYIRAGFPALWVTTHEEKRAEDELKAAAKAEKMGFWRWSVTQGWVAEEAQAKAQAQPVKEPAQALGTIMSLPSETVYVLRDFHPYFRNPQVTRSLRDLIGPAKASGRFIVVLSPVVDIPTELEKELTVTRFSLPTREELGAKLDTVIEAVAESNAGKPAAVEDRAALLDAASGLTVDEAENAFSLAWAKTYGEKVRRFDGRAVAVVRNEKAGAIKKSGLVEWVESKVDIGAVGGLGNVKADLRVIAPMFHDPDGAEKFGFLPEDRKVNIMLVGQPGCGKSLTAEAIAQYLKIGLVRTDFGRIFGSKVGESEQNVRRRNELVEAMAPCEDWWDEAEKGLAGASGKSEANPWEARVGQEILTWMEGHRSRLVIVACVNRVNQLPPEIVSRFQYVYFVDLPDEDEAVEIFNIHLAQRHIVLPDAADKVRHLAIQTHGYNGREIRNIVQTAMRTTFSAGEKKVSYERLVEAAKAIVPLSVTRADDLNEIRRWAKERKVRPASASSQGPEAAGRRVR